MNKSKDHLEFQIKKQISEREVTPSRDLWTEIEFQNAMNSQPKSKINWFLVAACLVLTVSLSTVLFFLQKPSENQPQIVKEAVPSNDDHNIAAPVQQNAPLAAQDDEKKNKKEITSQHKENELSALAVDRKKLSLKETVSDKKPEAIQISVPKIIAKADSSKIPVKKRKYVDPSTLLFSVEHKDVIEKTKDGSNVATIELNRK